MTKELVNPQEFGIEPTKATELLGNLPQLKSERETLTSQYDEVIKLDIEDSKTSKIARDLRIKIRDNRTKGIEVWHKNAKDFFLKGGQFVDAIKRMEIAINQRMEDNLEQIEKYQEIKEAKIKAEKTAKRMDLLVEFTEITSQTIENMSDEVFDAFLSGLKTKRLEEERLKKEEEEKQIEFNRKQSIFRERQLEIARYGNHAPMQPTIDTTDEEYVKLLDSCKSNLAEYEAEQEKLKAEAERLKKEKDAAEKLANEKLELERKERERIEKENKRIQNELAQKQKEEAERKAEAERLEKERIAEEKKAAKAPDKNKLLNWIGGLECVLPEMKDESTKAIALEIQNKYEGFKQWALKQIESI